MLNVPHTRINTIQNAPFSWKEKDTLTGAEKYMTGAIELPLTEMCKDCFSEIAQEELAKIEWIWQYSTATFHLRKSAEKKSLVKEVKILKIEAAKIYELEYQRILGTLFSLENDFWKAFYKRQEIEADKILMAIDALYFISKNKNAIAYQLLIQAFREILKGQYSKGKNQHTHYKNAKRLLVDLPSYKLLSWLNERMSTT